MSEILILTVTGIQVTLEKSFPPAVIVHASGEVFSLGFTLPRLNPNVYIAPPEDGIYEFAFVATEPQEPQEQVVSPIDLAPYRWEAFPEDLRGIKILAETNALEKKLFEEPQLSGESIY